MTVLSLKLGTFISGTLLRLFGAVLRHELPLFGIPLQFHEKKVTSPKFAVENHKFALYFTNESLFRVSSVMLGRSATNSCRIENKRSTSTDVHLAKA